MSSAIRSVSKSTTIKKELETLINKDIETRLIEMYIKGWITKEQLEGQLDKLEESDKPDMPEPPTVY